MTAIVKFMLISGCGAFRNVITLHYLPHKDFICVSEILLTY